MEGKRRRRNGRTQFSLAHFSPLHSPPLPSSFSFLLLQQSFWWRGIRRFKDVANFATSSATHVLEMSSTKLSCYSCMVANPIRGPLHPPSSSDGNRGRSPAHPNRQPISVKSWATALCRTLHRKQPHGASSAAATTNYRYPISVIMGFPASPTSYCCSTAARHALDS